MVSDLKPVSDFPDYFVSKEGRVWSNKSGGLRELKALPDRLGYLHVCLYNAGKAKRFKIHRLVLAAFFGESALQVNHKDGVKSNNNLSNLEYCTPKENIAHAHALGLMTAKVESARERMKAKVGSKNVSSVLSDEEASNILKLKGRFSQAEAARLCQVSSVVVRDLWKGVSYQYLPRNQYSEVIDGRRNPKPRLSQEQMELLRELKGSLPYDLAAKIVGVSGPTVKKYWKQEGATSPYKLAGVNSNLSKYSDEKIEEIMSLKGKMSGHKAAEITGVSYGYVYSLWRGEKRKVSCSGVER